MVIATAKRPSVNASIRDFGYIRAPTDNGAKTSLVLLRLRAVGNHKAWLLLLFRTAFFFGGYLSKRWRQHGMPLGNVRPHCVTVIV